MVTNVTHENNCWHFYTNRRSTVMFQTFMMKNFIESF